MPTNSAKLSAIIDILRCPLTGEALAFTEEGNLQTESGAQAYPMLNGVPWLLSRPRNSLLDWSAKLNHFQQSLLHEIAALEAELVSEPSIVSSTQARIQTLLHGKKQFLVEITQLMQPLATTKITSRAVYDALRDRAPMQQNLLSYEANIYRDWVWGDEENQQSMALLESIAPESLGKLCVMGAGACKLALDVHQQLMPDLTVATDINPLFLLAMQQLLAGETLSLTEFPLQPKSSECVSICHDIAIDTRKTDNFHLAFSDAAKPAFAAAAFDTVLTPWLIDIQPHALLVFLKQLNHYLPIGGVWLNLGSLVFHQARDVLCYSREEIDSIAEQAGFVLEHCEQQSIPYLKSPYNAGHRVETVWVWRARKIADAERVKDLQDKPDWLLDPELPVPALAEFATAAQQNRLLTEILERIDGKVSTAAIARKLAQQYQADEAEMRHMLHAYLNELL